MEISDLRTNISKFKIQPKNGPLFIDDIEGARAKPERHKKKNYNYMEYRDITDTTNLIRLQQRTIPEQLIVNKSYDKKVHNYFYSPIMFSKTP